MNFDGLEMQKWNIQTDRAQRVDEKNGIICPAIIFASGVMVIKMSKMAHFFAKNQSPPFGENVYVHLNDLI